MKPKDIAVSLYANGHLVRRADPGEILVEMPPEPSGRAMAIADLKVPLDMQVVVTFDPSQIAAIHARSTYGFVALRALLDALPGCDLHDAANGKRVATRRVLRHAPRAGEASAAMGCDGCTDDLPGGTAGITDLQSAPAVRHIESYVLDFERENKVPERER